MLSLSLFSNFNMDTCFACFLLLHLFFFIHQTGNSNSKMKRDYLCYRYSIYNPHLRVFMRTSIFIHSWLFQYWLLISYFPPVPGGLNPGLCFSLCLSRKFLYTDQKQRKHTACRTKKHTVESTHQGV